MPRPVLNYESKNILRGDTPRAIRLMGGLTLFLACFLALAFWLFVKSSRTTRIAVWLACVGLGGLATLSVAIISKYTMAEIHDGKINFYFCGFRTRSFPLDAGTAFQLKKVGRTGFLVITRAGRDYVPNGAFDHKRLFDFVRDHGAASLERKLQDETARTSPTTP